MITKKLKTIVIERPMGGWAPTLTQLTSAPLEGKEDQYSKSQYIDLFRLNFLGHIAPGFLFDKLTDTNAYVTNLPLNGVSTSDATNLFYAVLSNTRLVAFNQTDVIAKYDITLSGTHATHTLVTSSNNQDCMIFKDNAATPVEWVLWSWEDTTDGDISAIHSDGTNASNNLFSGLTGSGVLTTGVPHMMTVGPDGNIYITNGQYIASATGTAGLAAFTGNTQALNLGVGWVAASIRTYGNFLVICGYQKTSGSVFYSGKSRVWFWDTAAPNPNYTFDLDDVQATALAVDSDGEINVFTNGKQAFTRIKKLSGNSFSTVAEYPGGAITVPKHGSVDNWNYSLIWGSTGLDLFQLFNGGFHQPGHAWNDTTPLTLIGMVKNLMGNNPSSLVVGSADNSSPTTKYGIFKVDTTTYYPSAIFWSALKQLPYKSTIRRIRVYFSQFGTGASVLISLYKDYDTATDLLNLTIDNATYGAISQFSKEQVITDVSAFYVKVKFNHASITNVAAIIRKIEVLYELSDKV